MKVGVFDVVLADLSLEETCAFLEQEGVQAIEVGCGGFPGKAHCNPKELLADEGKRKEFADTIARHGLVISGLSSHGNMLHPVQEIAARFEEDLTDAVLLAEQLGVKVVNTFSGCPGGSPADQSPNWIVASWPEDFSKALQYQWEDVLIPYWQKKAAFAREHGVKFALEMHPGFPVYNTRSLIKLREAVGEEIGANLDPSHLLWQGMDPCAVIRALGKAGAIYHFHAKDTRIDPYNTALNGVLDITHYSDELNRSWMFCSVGYGQGSDFWKNVVSELRMANFDGALSIEHEDCLMSGREGLKKAIECLKSVVLYEERGAMYWA